MTDQPNYELMTRDDLARYLARLEKARIYYSLGYYQGDPLATKSYERLIEMAGKASVAYHSLLKN